MDKKKARLFAREQRKIQKQRKLGLIKDPRSREVVLKEALNDLFEETGGYGVWNETRGWDGKVKRLSLYHGVVVTCDSDSGEFDRHPLHLLSLNLKDNCLCGNFRKTFKMMTKQH